MKGPFQVLQPILSFYSEKTGSPLPEAGRWAVRCPAEQAAMIPPEASGVVGRGWVSPGSRPLQLHPALSAGARPAAGLPAGLDHRRPPSPLRGTGTPPCGCPAPTPNSPGLHRALFRVSHFLLRSERAAEPHLSVSFTLNCGSVDTSRNTCPLNQTTRALNLQFG